jgi:hypothetical protein
MVTEINLPVEGELDWDDKIAAAFVAVRDRADSAYDLADGIEGTDDAGIAAIIDTEGETYAAIQAIASQFVAGEGAAAAAWFNGVGAPAGGTGQDGDYYLRDTGQVYRKGSGTWTDTGISLKGAAGTDGTDGTDGTNGTNGLNGVDIMRLQVAGVYQPRGVGAPGVLFWIGQTAPAIDGTYAANGHLWFQVV